MLHVRREYEDVMTGINTSDHFDELDRALNEQYESVHEGHIYRILRLKQSDSMASTSNSKAAAGGHCRFVQNHGAEAPHVASRW